MNRLIDPIKNLELAGFLFFEANMAWIASCLLLSLAIHVLLRSNQKTLTPVLVESLRWARLTPLAVAAFRLVVVLSIMVTPLSKASTTTILRTNIEWVAMLLAVVVYTTYRATLPWVRTAGFNYWGFLFGSSVALSLVMGAALYHWRFG